MQDNTLTLIIDGEVHLNVYTEVLRHFSKLVNLISSEVVQDVEIEWIISDLQVGSAIATIVGHAPTNEPIAKVIEAYEQIGSALENNQPILLSEAVREEVATLVGHIRNDGITGLRFETAQHEYSVWANLAHQQIRTQYAAFGAVKGRVQSISNRRSLRFTLYDALFDKSVCCYIDEEQQDLMREIWGNDVIVFGRVTRDTQHGRAMIVRNITNIQKIIKAEPGSYKAARGVLAWQAGDEPAETAVRRLRDAED
jgi:hypothetical protein